MSLLPLSPVHDEDPAWVHADAIDAELLRLGSIDYGDHERRLLLLLLLPLRPRRSLASRYLLLPLPPDAVLICCYWCCPQVLHRRSHSHCSVSSSCRHRLVADE